MKERERSELERMLSIFQDEYNSIYIIDMLNFQDVGHNRLTIFKNILTCISNVRLIA